MSVPYSCGHDRAASHLISMRKPGVCPACFMDRFYARGKRIWAEKLAARETAA